MTTVINIHHKKPCDIRITRNKSGTHWGNPFSHMPNSDAAVIVGSRGEAVRLFEEWLDGTSHQWVEPGRRKWILQHLQELKDKVLGCVCAPKACHGDVYARRLNNPKFIDINSL